MKDRIPLHFFFFFVLSAAVMMAQSNINKKIVIAKPVKKKMVKEDSTGAKISQATGENVNFKDEDGNSLITITDEGTTGSITIPPGSAPSTNTNKLYNVGNTLYFNGSSLGSGGGEGSLAGKLDKFALQDSLNKAREISTGWIFDSNLKINHTQTNHGGGIDMNWLASTGTSRPDGIRILMRRNDINLVGLGHDPDGFFIQSYPIFGTGSPSPDVFALGHDPHYNLQFGQTSTAGINDSTLPEFRFAQLPYAITQSELFTIRPANNYKGVLFAIYHPWSDAYKMLWLDGAAGNLKFASDFGSILGIVNQVPSTDGTVEWRIGSDRGVTGNISKSNLDFALKAENKMFIYSGASSPTMTLLKDGTPKVGIRTLTPDSVLEVIGGVNISKGGLKVDYRITANKFKETIITAALTDGAPTATEINNATLLTPATAGIGWQCYIKDSDGSGLVYRIVSDGTKWYYFIGTAAL